MVITTNGSSEEALDIVPQVFMQFRGRLEFLCHTLPDLHLSHSLLPVTNPPPASALHLATSAFSTADVEVAVSQDNSSISQNVTSRTGLITVIGLNSTALTTLALTYVPPGRLDLSQLWATVEDEIAR